MLEIYQVDLVKVTEQITTVTVQAHSFDQAEELAKGQGTRVDFPNGLTEYKIASIEKLDDCHD